MTGVVCDLLRDRCCVLLAIQLKAARFRATSMFGSGWADCSEGLVLAERHGDCRTGPRYWAAVYELRRLEIKSKVNEKTTYDRRASVRELVVWAEKPTYNSSNATID
jgi:hypothetical protein